MDVFFILSGLVIVQSLDSFGYRARPFLIARVARIYPVFLVVFVFAVAVQPLATGFERWPGSARTARRASSGPAAGRTTGASFIVTHLTMTHGLFPNGVLPDVWVGFLGAAWSLSTEWQFYLLALLVGARLGLATMAWLFLVLAVVALAWQVAAPEAWQFSRAFLPNKAQYFALGDRQRDVVREGTAGLRPTSPCWRDAGGVRNAGWHRQAAAAGGVDSMSGGAAHGRHRDSALDSSGPGARFGVGGRSAGGRAAAIPAAGLARRGLLLHLPGATSRCRSCWA